MSFNIDKQTLDELNLTGKFKSGSVYALFNKVRTSGGERLLDHMFRHPLEEATAINHRSSVFQYFQQADLNFPFDVQQISQMREYVDSTANPGVIRVLAQTFVKRVLAGLTRDERYKKSVQGLQATIVTVSKCYAFVEKLQSDKGPYADKILAMKELLSDKRLQKLREIDIYADMPLKKLAYYEHALKSSLQREMNELLQFIFELDVNIAVSAVARQKKFRYATALPPERNLFAVKGLAHPGIDGAIGNDLRMDTNSNVIFLTGANMAGKSTLMKSIGISLYLAHMGFPLAVNEMTFSVRAGLYSSINVADNIGLGYSHFYAEVVRVKQAAEAAATGKRLLLMFDELFKGTNVKDAYDGTLAITKAFAEYRDCLFIVSTHIIEVGEALRSQDNIQFVYMPTVMEGVKPKYTYQLQQGITEDRQGMMIIRNEGILELMD
ncbi:MutS-related protein [Pseudobacter ginsenosidimutans]|jgi:DNA mismatch repair ATPase MutS|uniref:MutS-like protein n=1 Tax=Pseudobacter ginsenosidimutans TaxID=661488 RepID=A0A4Q7N010_9BACT|nr:DNA mismatch repair protein [Pseudobacter ginsenosidimutans]QEC43136.1 DNA mismatch repair protein [Pseudobacter ginsenosidimutans]RZS74492.1 MutS-like protein [Pseudobacter ginsenosidimutans]